MKEQPQIDYNALADMVFETFCKLSAFNGYQTLIVDQDRGKVQVFDMALSRNGFALFPETGEYALFTTDTGWTDRRPIFSELEKATWSEINKRDQGVRFEIMLKAWVSITTS